MFAHLCGEQNDLHIFGYWSNCMAGLEGRTLDRYELRQLLGKGGMADVYLAYDPHFDREVAVKVFKREDEDLLRRFIREAQLMASLSNPHLMPVYSAGTAKLDGVTAYYIVMPFMSGGTLRSHIRNNPLAPKEACRYLRDIADALDYMHGQGIIHRDIKASNVLLDAQGRCYLADFGIARATSDSTQLTSTGNVLGTVEYMAPELFESDRKADAYSDLYALGVLLFEMVTGRVPFTSESQIAVVTMHVSKQPPSPRSIVPSISPVVERVILRSLEKQPENRYANATTLASAFCRAAEAPVTASVQALDDLPLRIGTTNAQTRQGTRVVPIDYGQQSLQSSGEPRPYRPVPVTRSIPAMNDVSYMQMSQPYPTVYPAPRRSSGNAQGRIVAILAVLALLVVLVPIIYVTVTHYNGPTNNALSETQVATNLTATAQANANANATATQQQINANATASAATATAQANATATQIAKNATATATSQTATAVAAASATAGAIQTATATHPIYTSALTAQDTAQWDTNARCVFKPDGYHVHVNAPGVTSLTQFSLNGCQEANNQYTNFAAQVDLRELSGTSGGMFFHVVAPVGAYAGYLFEVDTVHGKYKISSSPDFSTGIGTKVLQDWTASSAIRQGATANTLKVLVKNGNLSFSINNVFLLTTQDTTYTSGNLAFLATATKGGADADMAYSNLSVYAVV
jgi:eukaryotic-like serine/threonine-protein kinase